MSLSTRLNILRPTQNPNLCNCSWISTSIALFGLAHTQSKLDRVFANLGRSSIQAKKNSFKLQQSDYLYWEHRSMGYSNGWLCQHRWIAISGMVEYASPYHPSPEPTYKV
ncbi:hypothetical protein MPER_09567 [Moniliophthora perniciosa FA553]|nr:hypothetical protein MPER_09567 [Moniliophthora perniciosa FA553]